MSMIQADDQLQRLVATTAHRLRLVQADFAQEEAQSRGQYLAEEIRQGLGQVPLAQRQRFLEELAGQFPVGEGLGEIVAAAAPVADDAVTLARRLAEGWGQLDEAGRRAVLERLGSAGIAASSAKGPSVPGVGDSALSALRGRLKLAGGANVDAERAGELLCMMLEVCLRLHPLVWQSWGTLSGAAGGSAKSSGPALEQQVGRFVSAAQGTSKAQVEAELEKMRLLASALVGAVAALGLTCGNLFRDRLSPDAIRSATPRPGVLTNRDGAYWQTYQRMAGELDPQHIEHEMRKLLAEFVLKLVPQLR